MAFPKKLKNFTAFVDGHGYAGKVTELTLPKLTLKTEEYRAGGMDLPVEIEMGMEKLEAELTFAEYDPNLFKLFGLVDGGAVRLTLRGAARADDVEAQSIVVNLEGLFREMDSGSWKAGDEATLKVAVAARFYKLTIDGVEMIEIDAENMVRKIEGVDQLAGIRSALAQ